MIHKNYASQSKPDTVLYVRYLVYNSYVAAMHVCILISVVTSYMYGVKNMPVLIRRNL